MTNENELDLEKKFLSDIEKATALSLEEKALEDFRRQKLYGQTSVVDGPTSSATTTKNSKSSITLQDYQKILKQRQLSLTTEAESTKSNQNVRRSTMIAPPPLFSPRRNSMEIRGTPSPSTTSNSTITNTAGSIVKKSEQKEYEPDLISFTSPTSTNDSNHANFVQLCDEINKINMRSNSVDAATLQYNRISPTPIFQASHAQSQMQIVPYTPQQKPSLAPEELSKLYSMNTVVGGYGLQRHGMMMNSQQPLTYQSPIQSNLMPQQNFHMPQNPTQQYYNSTSYMSQTSSPMPGGLQPFNLTFMRQPSMPVIASQSTPSPIQLNNVQMYATNRPHTPQELPSYVTSARQNQFQRDLTPSPSGGVNTSILTPLSQSNSTPTFNTYSSGSGVGSGSGMGPSTSGISLNTSMNSSGTTEPRLRRIVEPTKKKGDNLIDLDFDTNSRVDVLEAFDPLLTCDQSDTASDYYYEDDPFDYLYSGGTTCSDPVYDAVIKVEKHPFNGALTSGDIYSSTSEPGTSTVAIAAADTIPPPLPPRNSNEFRRDNPNVVLDRRKIGEKLYENIVIKKSYDLELVEFYNMVLKMRSMFKVDDERTNVGHVVASEFPNKFPDELSIMLLVHPSLDCFKMGRNHERGQIEGYGPPVAFTCSITSTVDHILTHVLYTLEGKTCELNAKDYMLRPIGIMEWLRPTSRLNQLECVHDSCKLEKDVQLCMCPKNSVNLQAIARTAQDDRRDAEIKLEDILPNESVSPINYESLMIILETLETEIDRLESAASDSGPHSVVSCAGVVQAIKAVCSLLGYIETLEISEATNHLKEVCTSRSYERSEILYGDKIDVLSDDGDYSSVKLRPRTFVEQIRKSCHQVRDAVQQLLDIYSHAFRVDFCVKSLAYPFKTISLASIIDPVVVSVSCLYRLPPHWKYDDYLLGTQIYHGTRFIVEPQVTQCVIENVGSYPRLKFKSWLYFHNTPVCVLPRESRLLFVLFGCTNETESNDKNDSKNQNSNGEPRQTKTELGWFSIQFFDFERRMITGSYLLPMWPPTTDKYLGPAPARGTHPYGNQFPVLGIEIPPYEGRVVFPEPLGNMPPAPKLDFNSLDVNLQQELIDTAEQGYQSAVDKREVLWEKRYYLQNFPHALPKVLSAAHSWDHASLVDMHALIRSWHELSPIQALELFLPKYPDLEVRSFAVKWFSRIENDQFVDYLPQLVQSLKHDTYEASSMAQLLLSRSLESPRIAHHLYWLLVHSLPGDSPQNSNNLEMSMHNANMELITQSRYHRRNQILLRALLATCGEKLSTRFLSQNMMCKMLGDIAQSVKQNKNKQAILVQKLEQIHHHLLERPTALPLNPGLEVAGVVTSQCSYFNSNTLPLKISFIGPDQQLIPAIFKSGDDLQQDMLTLQLVRLMDKLWLKEGLDLKMVTFSCVPTSEKKGMIELVSDAETLRKIQVEWGLTGSFKDKPIAEWLARQNPNPFDYQRAVDNFTVSCAGYSVATYILGICDRHNDNIMLKTSGHIFHIDFGKFLGDAQMFGNFKRDRTPFVLTSDMAYVINGGDKPSTKFHHFVDLCCQAFNIVRKHGDLLLHMLTLMAHSGIPGVSADSVNYVRKALLPGQSNAEAAASFAKMIHISLKSWFTQFNFFLHNLAQLKFSSEEGNGELLSFVPRTYTMAQDGRLKSVTVHGYQKRYDLEKYYTYILKVTRQNQPDPAYLFRSYKEFLEFHQKLCLDYPLAKLHSLPSGLHVGRSNIKTVADRRLPEIQQFLVSLFRSADEIAHSNLVYTFFHPLLRDQQDADIHVKKVKERKNVTSHESVRGEIMFSIQYHRGTLTVMIRHARSLPVTSSGQEPNTYVKCYLKPDSMKSTKRKTKVVRKSCCPSFMETLEYRMPLEIIQLRSLEVTVWSHDSLQENEFLGGVQLVLKEFDLRDELMKWYPLSYIPRS